MQICRPVMDFKWLDKSDRGTNAKNMIMNKEIALKLGYVGVKGRCQEDIVNKKGVAYALE
jgi:hypothetical protein